MQKKTIRRGSRGQEVARAQALLNQIGGSKYDALDIDGVFGRLTQQRVYEFQRGNGLSDDGIIGPMTWAKLYSEAKGAAPTSTKIETPEQPVYGPEISDAPKAAPVPVAVYIHGVDAPDLKKTFAIHKGIAVQHFVLGDGARAKPISTSIIDHLTSRNGKIADLVINSHGAGGGRITIKGGDWPADNVAKVIGDLRKKFLPRAQIRIYACLFASSKAKWKNSDAYLNPDDGIGYGAGTRAMIKIAKAARVPVSAGFRVQYGTSGSFKGPYIKAYPSGSVVMMNGQNFSTQAQIQFWMTGQYHKLGEHLKKHPHSTIVVR